MRNTAVPGIEASVGAKYRAPSVADQFGASLGSTESTIPGAKRGNT
jgi:hypothetical protein